MDDRNVVDAMHRLELIRRMRIQTMLRGTDAHRGQGRNKRRGETEADRPLFPHGCEPL